MKSEDTLLKLPWLVTGTSYIIQIAILPYSIQLATPDRCEKKSWGQASKPTRGEETRNKPIIIAELRASAVPAISFIQSSSLPTLISSQHPKNSQLHLFRQLDSLPSHIFIGRFSRIAVFNGVGIQDCQYRPDHFKKRMAILL